MTPMEGLFLIIQFAKNIPAQESATQITKASMAPGLFSAPLIAVEDHERPDEDPML